MKKFTVLFEIFGKKLKTDVMATSEEKAKQMIRDRIVFHAVRESRPAEPTLQHLKDIFGMK